MKFIKFCLITIMLWISATFGIMAQTPTGTLPTQTGTRLVNMDNIQTQQAYVLGVMDGAFTTDSAFTFLCKDMTKFTETEIADQIIAKIKSSDELRNQTVVFSIMNAYNELYCPDKPKSNVQ